MVCGEAGGDDGGDACLGDRAGLCFCSGGSDEYWECEHDKDEGDHCGWCSGRGVKWKWEMNAVEWREKNVYLFRFQIGCM